MKERIVEFDNLNGTNFFERFCDYFQNHVFKNLETDVWTILISPEIDVFLKAALNRNQITIPENVILRTDVDIPCQTLCLPIHTIEDAVSFSIVGI